MDGADEVFEGGAARATAAGSSASSTSRAGRRRRRGPRTSPGRWRSTATGCSPDLDPLASLHGFRPELDLLDGGPLCDAIRYDDPVPIADLIRPTRFDGLDTMPGDLDLMEIEHDTPAALARRDDRPFLARIAEAPAWIEDRYDVAAVDCPPRLGFIAMAALSAVAVAVTIHPRTLDVRSMGQFRLTTSNLPGVVADAGGNSYHAILRGLCPLGLTDQPSCA